MDTFDDFLTDKIKKDRIDIRIDNSTFNHFHALVNLNATQSNVKKNSIFSFLSDFFNPKFLILKLAFVGILLFLIIGNKGNNRQDNFIFNSDTASIQNNAFDTLNSFNNQIGDSLFH